MNGFYHSLVLYIVSELIFLFDHPQADGKLAGHWLWGTALYTAVLATVLGKAALVTKCVSISVTHQILLILLTRV